MPSERIQRQIDRLLDEAEQAVHAKDWALAQELCQQVLTFDADNDDAKAFLTVARRSLSREGSGAPTATADLGDTEVPPAPPLPTEFANGRYRVLGLLGEGGRKVVYRAHDTLLDRDVAFARVRTDGLDDDGRERVKREAQVLGRLGAHPNIVTVFELGEEAGQPYIVTELLPGGDLAQQIAAMSDHRLPMIRVLEVAQALAAALVFAHGKGVVHRDVKPGNVWLAMDGTPKLGDFGLAVAASDPRLTQTGMMAGTAFYMAPEQAGGGEVTARSDLYSLGCLLYELVTGRPPFVGDESVAIIGQHLQANPVSPTWHRPDCPAALEALILRLLEKNPSRRPASAEAVLDALASIGRPLAPNAGGNAVRGDGASTAVPDAAVGAVREPPTLAQNPVYQRAFVGREQELRQLEGAFDAAVSGRGGLVMVVGEPGIGKTTLTEQLSTYAGLRGGRVLAGHCYEEGSLSLPYLPFVEAMRSYVLDREPAKLRSELGNAAAEVARIVSEVRDRVQVEPSPGSGDGGEDRYRLLQGVASFLRNAAQVQPLVLVLEDLHDADRGTLDLLQFLARQLAGARLLLIGTYRDVEVDRQHPLSAALAELQRGASFARLRLRGLTADEVQRMLSAIAGQDVRWALAEAVHRQTEGNPLFVQEVIRYLVEEGLLTREGGRWHATGQAPLVETIPEGLRDVIGKRLGRLSPRCNQVLATAAVIGRDFQLATLTAVSNDSEERLTDLLDEAVKVAVVQEQARGGSVQYRFAHAFFRQTLYDELSAARRIRLHQQVATALEQQYAARLEEHAAELAEHFTHSSTPADLAKAVQYGEVAAQRATAVYAYGEAVRLLEQALDVQEVLDPADAARRCDLQLRLCDALLPAGAARRVLDTVAPAAFAAAHGSGDQRAALRACLVATEALGRFLGVNSFGDARLVRWVERARPLVEPGTPESVRLLLEHAAALSAAGNLQEGRTLALQGLAQARALRHPETLCYAGGIASVTLSGTRDLALRLELAREVAVVSLAEVSTRVQHMGLFQLGGGLLANGDRRGFEEAAERHRQLALRTHDSLARLGPELINPIRLATIEGRLEAACAIAAAHRQSDDGASALVLHRAAAGWARTAQLLLGRTQEELALRAELRDLAPDLGRFQELVEALLAAQRGDAEAAGARLAPFLTMVAGEDGDLLPVNRLCLALEVAVLSRDAAATATLVPLVEPCAGLSTATDSLVNPARLLGDAMRLLGQRERAQAFYEQALVTAGRIGFRPEVALSRLGLAESQADGDESERVAAKGHLAFAIGEFEAMGMRPALERARRLEAALAPGEAPAGAPDPNAGELAKEQHASVRSKSESSPANAAPISTHARGGSAPKVGGQGAQRPAEQVASISSSPIIGGRGALSGASPPSSGHVFISYSSDDLAAASALDARLLADSVPVWLDKRSIPPGSSWDAAIVEGIKQSALVVVFVSPKAVASDHVRQELRLAMQYRKPILPLLLAPTAYPGEIEYVLAGRQWVEVLNRPRDEWLTLVLDAVQRMRA